MRTVWVYRIPLAAVAATGGAQFDIQPAYDLDAEYGTGGWVDYAPPVHVGMQHGQIAMWFEVDTEAKRTNRRTFVLVGTGHEVPTGAQWVGTVMPSQDLVLHVYELVLGV